MPPRDKLTTRRDFIKTPVAVGTVLTSPRPLHRLRHQEARSDNYEA